MKKRCNLFYGLAIAVLLTLYVGCGGGGGGDTATPSSSAGTGTAALSWSAPTTNSEGGTLNSLSGYYVYHGTASGSYSDKIAVGNVTSYTYTGLASGPHYFTVSAYNDAGEGPKSSEGSKTIP